MSVQFDPVIDVLISFQEKGEDSACSKISEWILQDVTPRLFIHLPVNPKCLFFPFVFACVPSTCVSIHQSIHPLICLSTRNLIYFVWSAIPWHSYTRQSV